jgi:hypothetical protein
MDPGLTHNPTHFCIMDWAWACLALFLNFQFIFVLFLHCFMLITPLACLKALVKFHKNLHMLLVIFVMTLCFLFAGKVDEKYGHIFLLVS